MAYGIKYTGTLIDHFGRTVKVDISENNYSGAEIPVILAGLTKNINGDDQDLFVSKLGSLISVGILTQSDFQYIDLFTGDSRKYKLQVYIDAVLDWVGWVIPENFTEPYNGTPYATTITARDGLGELSSIKYEFTGVQSSLFTLLYCLNKLAPTFIDTIKLNVSVDIYEENHVTTDSSLNQTYIDQSRYEGMNCDEVLNDLLNLWGARVYQKNAEWWFVNTVGFGSVLNVFKYGFSGILISQSNINTELFIGLPNNDKFANSDQTLNVLPAWKEQTIIRDFIFKKSALLNYEFDDWSQVGADYLPDGWSQSGTGVIDRYSSNGKVSARFVDYSTVSQPTNYILQTINNIEGNKHGLKLNLSFKLNKLTDDDILVGSQFWAKIVNKSGGGDKYLTNDATWSSTEVFINFQKVDVKLASNSAYIDYEIPNTLVIPEDGSLEVYVYSAFGSYLILDSFQLQLTFPQIIPLSPEQFGAYPDEPIVDLIQVGNNTYIPDDLELLTGDFPDLINTGVQPYNGELNEQHIYTGGLFLNNGKSEVTTNWSKLPVNYANKTNLHKVVATAKSGKVNLPQWAITGSILTKDIKPDSTIIDYEVNNNKYLVCNGNHDMEKCIFNGTFIQIGNSNVSGWILGEPSGIWNDANDWDDNGQWVDSAQVEETIELAGVGPHDISAYLGFGDTITVLPLAPDSMNDAFTPITTVPHIIGTDFPIYVVAGTQTVSYSNTFEATAAGVNTKFTVNVTI
jgi:hypothetical protein